MVLAENDMVKVKADIKKMLGDLQSFLVDLKPLEYGAGDIIKGLEDAQKELDAAAIKIGQSQETIVPDELLKDGFVYIVSPMCLTFSVGIVLDNFTKTMLCSIQFIIASQICLCVITGSSAICSCSCSWFLPFVCSRSWRLL